MPKKLKVGFFPLHSFLRPGGVKNHVLALKEAFKNRGISSKIVVPLREASENYGQDIILLGASFPFEFSGTESDLTWCFQPSQIDKVLKKEKFDVLHFHNFGLHSAQILEKSSAVNVLTFHAAIDEETIKFFKSFPLAINLFKEKVREEIHGIIGVAPFNLELFDDFPGPKAVIPNGIWIEDFNPATPKIKKYADGKINILFIGRLEERKGLIYLLRAYRLLQKKHKNIRLLIVGKGELEKEYKEWAKSRRLKDVVFAGEISNKELMSYYATCDIFCSPAIFGESFGIVLLEAMAMQKPIVAFANRGYKAVLRDKGKGFLVKPKDWRVLAKKLEVFIKDEKLRKEMGEWGRKEAQQYDWLKISRSVLKFYKTAVDYKNKTR